MTTHRSISIEPCRRIEGSLKVPGDKSISHRALLVAMVRTGTAELEGLVPAGDVLSTLAAVDRLTSLNLQAQVDLQRHKGIGRGRDFQIAADSPGWDALGASDAPIDVGNSGTTMRILAGILAGSRVTATLTGDASLSRRPMGRVAEPLRQMGADIQTTEEGTAPLRIRGRPLRGVDHDLAVASAQVKSALLFAGLRATGTTGIREPSPSRDHTERLLRELGVPIVMEADRLVIKSIDLQGDWSLKVPGDFSSAAFLLVTAAILPGSSVRIEEVGVNPTRTALLEVLRRYGADVRVEDVRDEGPEPVATVIVSAGDRRGLEIAGPSASAAIDELPLVAVLGAFAEGETVLRDAGELRVKESDRIEAVVDAMRALGADIDGTPDGFIVRGRGGVDIVGGQVHARGDHRIALAGAVAALAARGPSRIEGWEATEISYPWFEEDLGAVVVR